MTEFIPTSAPKFTFEGISTQARVVKVYDGDSYDIIFQFKNDYYQIHCRAFGYNTAELKSNDENEKIAAYKARDFLREKVLGKVFPVDFKQNDKYGRPMIVLHIENTTLDKLMITAGHAKEYYGQGTKQWV